MNTEKFAETFEAQLLKVRDLNDAIQDGADDAKTERLKQAVEANRLEVVAALKEEQAAPAEKFHELTDRVETYKYFDAASGSSKLDGAAKELNEELGLPTEQHDGVGQYAHRGVVAVPFAAFDRYGRAGEALAPDKGLERYADTVTTLPSSTAPDQRRQVSPYIWKSTVKEFLGVSSPAIPYGEVEYPWVSSVPTGAAVAEGSAQDAETFGLTVNTGTLKTVGAGVVIGHQSLAKYEEKQMDQVIRTILAGSLINLLNDYLVNGSGTNNQATGILTRINAVTFADGKTGATADDTALTWAEAATVPFVHKDDRYITDGPIKILMGLATEAYLRGLFRGSNSDVDAVQRVQAFGVSMKASARIPDKTGDGSTTGEKQNAIFLARPSEIEMPMWGAYSLLHDPYTVSSKNEVAYRAWTMYDITYPNSAANEIRGGLKLSYVLSNKT